jgi:hypothetical protein
VAKQTDRRRSRKNSPSLDEAIKLLKPYKGRDGIYSMFSRNDKGDFTEIGVYNYRTKKYTIYRSDMVDPKSLEDIREIIKGQ